MRKKKFLVFDTQENTSETAKQSLLYTPSYAGDYKDQLPIRLWKIFIWLGHGKYVRFNPVLISPTEKPKSRNPVCVKKK